MSGSEGQQDSRAPFADMGDLGVACGCPGGRTRAGPADPWGGALPGAGLAHWALMARRLRDEVIGGELFSDPAWDILLDLYTALANGARVKSSSVSVMAGVPPSTGRRWVNKLIELGLIERVKEWPDQRFTYLGLSAKGRDIMGAFMTRLTGKGIPPLLDH